MKINWKHKLSSRKFWAFLASFVASLLIAFNLGENEIAQITSVITAFGSMAVYVLSEAKVDVANAKSNEDEKVLDSTEDDIDDK